MAEKKRGIVGGGTGYLSLMMIFVVISVSILAALSFSAATNEKKYSEKSAEYTAAYYQADYNGKLLLSEILTVTEGYMSLDDFMLASDLEAMGVELRESRPDRLTVSWREEINERQSIAVEVEIFRGYHKITRWQTVSTAEENDGKLNVWTGE